MLSSKLSNEVHDDLFLTITEEKSPVVYVLSAQKDQYDKKLLNNKVLQYITPTENNTIFNVLRVTNLEKEQ